jgi:hypothetical protein
MMSCVHVIEEVAGLFKRLVGLIVARPDKPMRLRFVAIPIALSFEEMIVQRTICKGAHIGLDVCKYMFSKVTKARQ